MVCPYVAWYFILIFSFLYVCVEVETCGGVHLEEINKINTWSFNPGSKMADKGFPKSADC